MKAIALIFILGSALSAYSQQQGSCYFKMEEGQNYQLASFQVQRQLCDISFDSRKVETLRTFKSANRSFALVADSEKLQTYIVDSSCLTSCTAIDEFEGMYLSQARYSQLLNYSTQSPFPIDNDGLIKDPQTKNNYLTIDLCPSSKSYESDLFKLVAQNKIPVALAISGGWMKRHQQELNEILELKKVNKLEITWVNHTMNHPYTPNLENQHNFLLRSDVDPLKEILDQEFYMLSQGLVPSIFIRYPGLISDEQIIQTTKRLGLIPIGSQAWIAKTKKFTPGDIILIHGNGNESIGVRLFFDLIKGNKILNSAWKSLTNWGQSS